MRAAKENRKKRKQMFKNQNKPQIYGHDLHNNHQILFPTIFVFHHPQ